jgi:hypothetical protein
VWKLKLSPDPRRTFESAENEPCTVNVEPSVTGNDCPLNCTVVAGGKVPVFWPYDLEPCWFTLAPWLV